MRSEITELRTLLQALQNQLQTVSKTAYASRDTLEKTDIMDLDEKLHKLKRKCVQQDDYQVSRDSFDDRISKLETVRMTQKQWATKAELKKHASELAQSMETKIQTHVTESLTIHSDLVQHLHTRIENDLQHLTDIEDKRETVVDELNEAFETLRDELSHEVKENTMHELYDDLNQDITLQTMLQQLIQDACDPITLQAALETVLDCQL
jgi:hypothetical protein